jgi:hypothetical protein
VKRTNPPEDNKPRGKKYAIVQGYRKKLADTSSLIIIERTVYPLMLDEK